MVNAGENGGKLGGFGGGCGGRGRVLMLGCRKQWGCYLFLWVLYGAAPLVVAWLATERAHLGYICQAPAVLQSPTFIPRLLLGFRHIPEQTTKASGILLNRQPRLQDVLLDR